MTLPLLVTLSLAADLLTATPAGEQNPLAAAILAAGPLAAVAAKAAEAAVVLAVVAIIRERRPWLAGLVAAVAVGAGVGGAWSNVA